MDLIPEILEKSEDDDDDDDLIDIDLLKIKQMLLN